MKNGFRFLFCLFAATAPACNKPSDVSEVSGALTEKNPVCVDYSETQYTQLRKELENLDFFHNFTDAEEGQLIKHFNAIPPLYRKIMIDASRSGDFRGFFKEKMSAAGSCLVGRYGCQKISLSSTQKGVIQFSLIHEVGHGMEAQVRKKSGLSRPDFETVLESLLFEGRDHNSGPHAKSGNTRIRSYSFSSVHEFFADSFHNYYCSPESNEFVKKYLPKNYEFLQAYLEKPVWAVEEETIPDPEGDPKAVDHIKAVVSLYNEASKSCDLAVKAISDVNANGDYLATVVRKSEARNSENAETAEIAANLNKNFSRELSELRRTLPALIADCPSE